jgi:hypothetical protein
MGTGENSGTWGTITNVNLGTALEEAIVGSADVTFSSGTVTLTLTDTNSSQTARNLRLNLTGTSGGAQNLIVPGIEKAYLVNNGCADAITVKNATGTGIAVPAGKTMWVYNTGANVVDAVTHLSSLTLTTPLPNSSTTASSSNGASTIVARDASGNFTANTATLTTVTGAGSGLTSLNASALTTGTINTLRVTGAYTGITQVGTLTAGVWNASTIAVANGGTGATSAANAQTNLDVPSRTGAGASGTWSINITGNAATATSATSAGSATTATSATSATTATTASVNGAKCFGNFTGTGTPAFKGNSFNVSSIGDLGTGEYEVNIGNVGTTNMTVCKGLITANNLFNSIGTINSGTQFTNECVNNQGGRVDPANVMFAVFVN